MDSATLEKRADELTTLAADLFIVDAHYLHQNQVVLSLRYRYDPRKSTDLLKDRLKSAGYRHTLTSHEDSLLLSVNPERKLHIPTLNITLFLLTLASVYFVPVFIFNLGNDGVRATFERTLQDLHAGSGLVFTVAMISILLVHEMGHFVAGRRRGIVTSWPYFIPAPNFIGTFGAVIKSKSPFWNRRDLIEVGATGPIAGWIVALGWLIYGLTNSQILPPSAAPIGVTGVGDSLIFNVLRSIVIGSTEPGAIINYSEAAFAGWVGMLVTALNMLPIGQLDGGHVIYGLAGKKQKWFGWAAMAALVVLGFQSATWWVFAAIGFAMGVAHPPTLDDRKPMPTSARLWGLTAVIILILSFTPVPFR